MKRNHILFLIIIYIAGLAIRLYPRLTIDPHLLTFQGDIWYRLAMAQHILDNAALPNPDLRYLPYGVVPMWYPPLSPLLFAFAGYLSGVDIPTISSRFVPFIEALSPLSIFLLARHMYDDTAAYIATISLALTPTFVFWTGISDPQSLTLFLIPFYILLLFNHIRNPSPRNIVILGIVLGLNFLFHLSYFVAVMVLFSISAALVFRRMSGTWLFKDLSLAVIISQLLTAPWWLPQNLYWWWIMALVTSSGLYSVSWQVSDFGVVATTLGLVSIIYLLGRHRHFAEKNWIFLLLFWAIPLFIESQNEAILFAINRVDLTWTTLGKPLEGFRFFPYLAQPVSIAVGAAFSDISKNVNLKALGKGIITPLILLLVFAAYTWGLTGPYDYRVKFQTSGLTPQEYEAAVWFRENSRPDSRIAADYYRAQMLSGVTGGKVLDGGMFPLRNVKLPYISVPAVVQDDLYILYNTSDSIVAKNIAAKYNLSHIFYSRNMESYGNLLSNHRPASQYGVPINHDKFRDSSVFRVVYSDVGNSVLIYEVLY